MALQGNPFLGKLKIPAPDLSRIPSAPFDSGSSEKDNDSAQSGNKPQTNRQQSGYTTDNKVATNRKQTGNKVADLEDEKNETGNKVGTQPATLSATKWQQTANKPATKVPFSSLIGLQRAIMIFLYEACKTARGRYTDSITLEHISSSLYSSSGSIKTTLQRLEFKQCISRVEFKNGRGGWSKYEIPESLFREMLQLETDNKLATNRKQSGNKVGTQPATEPATSLSSSSSFLDLKNFKTTTTEDVDKISLESTRLNPEWQQVDLSPLSEIGFTQTHLLQILRDGKFSSESVQDSIHYFAFDLNRNNKRKEINGQPLNFFMGILRRGMPYAAPANYESPQDQILRKNLEAKRLQSEKRSQMEAEIKEIEFEEWYSKLSEEEKLERVPMLPREGSGRKAAMRSQFDEHIWPELAQAVLGLTKIDRAEISKQIEQSLEENSV